MKLLAQNLNTQNHTTHRISLRHRQTIDGMKSLSHNQSADTARHGHFEFWKKH
jgi:hypothetical protein